MPPGRVEKSYQVAATRCLEIAKSTGVVKY